MSAEKHLGHRERMRNKAELIGLEFLSEHEQLEIILYSVIPRGNTNETHELLDRFHSIYGVLTADAEELKKVDGIGSKAADFLRMLPSVLGIVRRSKLFYENDGSIVLKDTKRAAEFVTSLFESSISENIFAIYLNKAYRVINYERLNEGSMDSVYFDVKKLMKHALINQAYFVILAHNHPSGNVRPSVEDRSVTNRTINALSNMNVVLYDHIIVSGDNYYSFRENG